MVYRVKQLAKQSPFYVLFYHLRHRWIIREWESRGRPIPPPSAVKQAVVKEYGQRFGMHVLIETGTFLGEMVYACKDHFSRIVSIELDKALHERARQRFARFPHISIILGDSTRVLPEVLANISEPCLFWLDGHYSGSGTARGETETPILAELSQILTHSVKKHVLLIDDARLFTGEYHYPAIEQVQNFIRERNSKLTFKVVDDIIRIY